MYLKSAMVILKHREAALLSPGLLAPEGLRMQQDLGVLTFFCTLITVAPIVRKLRETMQRNFTLE